MGLWHDQRSCGWGYILGVKTHKISMIAYHKDMTSLKGQKKLAAKP